MSPLLEGLSHQSPLPVYGTIAREPSRTRRRQHGQIVELGKVMNVKSCLLSFKGYIKLLFCWFCHCRFHAMSISTSSSAMSSVSKTIQETYATVTVLMIIDVVNDNHILEGSPFSHLWNQQSQIVSPYWVPFIRDYSMNVLLLSLLACHTLDCSNIVFYISRKECSFVHCNPVIFLPFIWKGRCFLAFWKDSRKDTTRNGGLCDLSHQEIARLVATRMGYNKIISSYFLGKLIEVITFPVEPFTDVSCH